MVCATLLILSAVANNMISALNPPPPGVWTLTLEDNFDTFNDSLWTKGWSWCDGNGTAPGTPQPRVHTKASDTCYFADANSWVQNGTLVLANRRENSHGFNYTSGVINSARYSATQGFQQTYGYFEARVQPSPGGTRNNGMCPAFWMPNVLNHGDDGNREIDVMEIPGNPYFGGGRTVFGTVHTLHDGGSRHGNRSLDHGFWSDAFHDFAVLWTPDVLAWYIDGKEFYRTQDAAMIPHTPAYLVLDNEVGLGHLAPSHPWAGDPTHTQFPQFMRVDHVRVWQQAGFT